MKFATAYYLLLFYAVAAFKPLLPFVSDFFAHSFAKEYHLSTVHHKHGGDHVHQEVKKVAGQENPTQNIPTVRSVEPVSVHFVSLQQADGLSAVKDVKTLFPRFTSTLSNSFLGVMVPPPKPDRLLG